ncbi:putative ATP-grasp superfamily ATP-dependent carboligase [Devosia subaequoris]|uniref:Putative ATP-grasp superfamily ATP-dependent carboligase n=1 Tax=Devosia subaequoris TaxID=395930 RepID=A0A7W6NC64_9HYPH|nr:ATP-grasp domain-containing protein [Devosia subaequoris]MBB4052436.1 putative ATP-grasp superfamily ATP-dependent carboligase [Devosia subaequoris]MCP1209596.1 ATP-grasp domain-containing protein [Devosia subaequoris]
MRKVLIFGDDDRSVLTAVRSLGRAGIAVHLAPFNWNSPTMRSRYVSGVHHLPRYSDNPGAWLDELRHLLDQQRFDLLLPCCERSMLPLDQNRDRFADQTIALPAHGTLDVLNDKQKTRELCARLGVPTAPGRPVRDDDSAQSLVAELGLPLLIKQTRSYHLANLTARNGVVQVNTIAELEAFLATVPTREGVLAERYFDGDGLGLSVLARDGVISQAFQHRRLGETGTEGGSSLRISEAIDPRLHAAARAISAATDLDGVAMVEFRQDRTGNFILIEVNARLWGSLPLAVASGVDFPLYLFEQHVEGRTRPQVDYRVGLRGRNFLRDLHAIAMTFRTAPGQWPQALHRLAGFALQPVSWALGRERSDTFVRHDLGPALAQLKMAPRIAKNRALRRAEPDLERRVQRKSG